MLNTTKWGAQATTAAPISATDVNISLGYGTGSRFAPLPAGDHMYLTLKSPSKREVVRVTGVTGDTLTVERGQDGTTATSWGASSCIASEWNPAALCEFISSCSATASLTPSGVAPGKYCLACTTCITIGGDGRITKIDEPASC